MAYRVGVYASTGKSPYRVMFGLRMPMPVHLLIQPYDDVDRDPDSDEDVKTDEDMRPYEEIFSELGNVHQLIHQSCAANISTSQARQAKDYDTRHRGAQLEVGDLIMNYNTKAKQRKGDWMAPNWTCPYTIIKVHKNRNYSVKNSKGEPLTTKMCASNVKVWQEPTNWDSEPTPDWFNAQSLDDTEPTVDITSVKSKKSTKFVVRETSPEPWIPPAMSTFPKDDILSDSDYEGEPTVKQAQYPPPDNELVPTQKKRKNENPDSSTSKKVCFTQETFSEQLLPPSHGGMDKLKMALNAKVKKKRTIAQQKERKTALHLKQKVRKDDFFEQMLKVNELPNITPSHTENIDSSDSDDLTIMSEIPAGEDFTFLPLVYSNRKTVCDRVSLILRKMNIPHSQVGEKLLT